MNLVKDIPTRGNSSYEGPEAGVHVRERVDARSSKKASAAAAEGVREKVVPCAPGKTSEDQITKASRPW